MGQDWFHVRNRVSRAVKLLVVTRGDIHRRLYRSFVQIWGTDIGSIPDDKVRAAWQRVVRLCTSGNPSERHNHVRNAIYKMSEEEAASMADQIIEPYTVVVQESFNVEAFERQSGP